MTRKEAVVLVSRALAVIQLIVALQEITYLPIRFMSFHHYTVRASTATALPSDAYFKSYDQLDIAFLFARIAGLLFFALLFWKCGPRIQSALLPERDRVEQTE